MAVQIQFRRDQASNWTAVNPLLAQGELGLETDTGRVKVGDGSTLWNSLSYSFESVGGGGGDVAVEHDNAPVDATVTTFDFGHGLDATSENATEVDIVVDETELSFSDSSMNIGKAFNLSGDISDTISANTDNYAPSGIADASVLRLTVTGADRNLTGITTGSEGRVLMLANVGASQNLILKHDVTSTAANRFLNPGGVDYTIGPNSMAMVVYDSASSRWRVVASFLLTSATPANIGAAAVGTSGLAARADHVHATGADTPSTQAFGDSPVTGTGPGAAMSDHKHGFPTPGTITDLISTETFALQGDISDTISANTDNYAPTGLADASTIRVTASGADRNITGLTGGADGRVIILHNVGSFNITLMHDVTSTAANRFFCPGNVNTALAANAAAVLQYDSTSQRWRVVSILALGTDVPNPVGTAAAGTHPLGSHQDHVHATGASTPSTQAFGDSATIGSGPAASMTDHKHAMPANPVTGHEAAGDPHTGYRLESADHTHQSTGAQAGQLDHGAALTGLGDDDHPQYVLEATAHLSGTVALQGDISPTDTGTVDNWNPTNLSTSSVIRWNGASAMTLSGITGGADGRVLVLANVTTAQTITLRHDLTSTAGNRFFLPEAQDNFIIGPHEYVVLYYDTTSSRWRLNSTLVLSNATPQVESGSGSAGTSRKVSRDDHTHPADGGGGGSVSFATLYKWGI